MKSHKVTCSFCGKVLDKATEAEETESFDYTGYMCKAACKYKRKSPVEFEKETEKFLKDALDKIP